MNCFSDCAVLNTTSCTLILPKRNKASPVVYDKDGCFVEADYIREGDKYDTFLQVNKGGVYLDAGHKIFAPISIFFVRLT